MPCPEGTPKKLDHLYFQSQKLNELTGAKDG
jgi:hypothetical protein